MARHHLTALALATIAFTLGGCGSAHGRSASPVWRTPSAVQSGAGGGEASPTPAGSPPLPPPEPPTSPPASRPTSPSASPKPHHEVDKSKNAPESTETGDGPYGSITTTGTHDVALTFDDGPSRYTDDILDLLDKYHVKATFCMIGEQVSSYPKQVKRIVAEGHTLCNHTWDHDEGLRYRSDATIRSEMQKTNDAIHKIVPDAKIEYFRNPGGAFGSNTVRIAGELGMKPLMWSVDPRDWSRPGTQSIINTVIKHTHAGSIVLSHDGGGDRSETVNAYKVILPDLKKRFTLIPLPVASSA